MIEGSRIDMGECLTLCLELSGSVLIGCTAAHSNDPVAHLQDILAYQEAVAEVHKFVDGTLVIFVIFVLHVSKSSTQNKTRMAGPLS